MAIQPISSAIFNNRTANNVSFEAKSKESKKHSTIKSAAMAVPLATLIAMSPLNTSASERNNVFGNEAARVEMAEVQQSNRIRFTKGVDNETGNSFVRTNFDANAGTGKEKDLYTITFLSSTHDGKYQEVKLSRENDPKVDIDGKILKKAVIVKEIRPIKYKLVGDDGVCGLNISFDQIVTDTNRSYSSDAVMELIKSFAEGKLDGIVNDGAIKIGEPKEWSAGLDPVGRLYPFGDGSKRKGGTDWLEEGRETSESFGKCILNTNIKTRDGEYELMAYSSDGNDKDFENVVIQKKGEGKFKVAGITFINYNLWNNTHIGDFTLRKVDVYKRNSKEKARLLDQELCDILLEVTKDTRFNNAYKTENITSHSSVRPNGILGFKKM